MFRSIKTKLTQSNVVIKPNVSLTYVDGLQLIFCALLVVFIGGCGSSDKLPPPAPTANFIHPVENEVVEWDEYSGRLESPQVVNLSARVSGIIEQAPFKEGSLVNKGDVLFVMDSRSFAAELKSKEAELASSHAALAKAEAHFRRYERLKDTRAVSAEDYDEALGALRQAKASVATAEAARDVAQLNLEWTKVTAPITGRISKKLVTEGNLVTGGSGAGEKTQLTSISSVDPMFSYVNVPENAFVKYQRLIGNLNQEGAGSNLPCFIRLESEDTFTREGFIGFIDTRVEPGTGTVNIRCELSNKEGFLSAGLFARMRVIGSKAYQAVVIPETAIGTNQDSKFVLVVGDNDTVEARTIKLGFSFGKLRAVTSGISAADRVIVTGIQMLRPGTKVTPKETEIAGELLSSLSSPRTSSASPSPSSSIGAM